MFVIENFGPLQPLTCEDLRLILTEGGIIDRMDVHDLNNHSLQFDLPELCGVLYLLYTHKLNPESFRGLMLHYGLSQQLSHLVLLQTLNNLFFAVEHVHHTQPDHASHFLVWAEVNIASFQRFAISSLAFAAPASFLDYVVYVYTADTFPKTILFPPLLRLVNPSIITSSWDEHVAKSSSLNTSSAIVLLTNPQSPIPMFCPPCIVSTIIM